MKQLFLFALVVIGAVSAGNAQDLIIKKDGGQIAAKVLEVRPVEIKYRLHNTTDSMIYGISPSDIAMIRYEDGMVDSSYWSEATGSYSGSHPALFTSNPYEQGKQDAVRYYDGYKGAGTGVLIGSLLTPLGGLLPAIACSSTPPARKNLHYPNETLMQHADYAAGYEAKARKIKQARVWSNWGVGLGVNVGLALLLFVVGGLIYGGY
jgi:hypothetical protein